MGVKESRITYFDGSYYSGEVSTTGKEHGKGQIFYANGDHLKGNFVDGDCTYAIVTKKNGDTYEGQMRDIRYHGQGKLTIKNDVLSGLFRGGVFLHGKITSSDGSIYTGSIENGSKSGYAEYKLADGGHYKGFFKNDKYEGKGQLEWKDGTKYIGNFKSGLFDGNGHLIKFQKGRKNFEYQGAFSKGDFDGFGKLTFNDDNQYEGRFQYGKKNGNGIFTYSNGDTYEGAFVDDIKEDKKCKITKANGTTYVGGISNNVYHGHGTLTKSNGEYYVGEFKDGLKHGKGTLKTEEFLYEGEFAQDFKHGKAKMTYYNEEKTFQGSFQNGQMHGLCIEKSDKQYLQVSYVSGRKEGPYRKKIGEDYEQQGAYKDDQRQGPIKIRKGNQVAVYTFEGGVRGQEIKA